MNLIFDTGSTNIWVVGTKCNSTGCNDSRIKKYSTPYDKTTKSHINVKFGTGALSGSIIEDSVTLGEFCVDNQSFGVVEDEVDSIFDAILFEGLLGLAFPSMSANGKLPFFDNFRASHPTTSAEISFYFAPIDFENRLDRDELRTIGGKEVRIKHYALPESDSKNPRFNQIVGKSIEKFIADSKRFAPDLKDSKGEIEKKSNTRTSAAVVGGYDSRLLQEPGMNYVNVENFELKSGMKDYHYWQTGLEAITLDYAPEDNDGNYISVQICCLDSPQPDPSGSLPEKSTRRAPVVITRQDHHITFDSSPEKPPSWVIWDTGTTYNTFPQSVFQSLFNYLHDGCEYLRDRVDAQSKLSDTHNFFQHFGQAQSFTEDSDSWTSGNVETWFDILGSAFIEQEARDNHKKSYAEQAAFLQMRSRVETMIEAETERNNQVSFPDASGKLSSLAQMYSNSEHHHGHTHNSKDTPKGLPTITYHLWQSNKPTIPIHFPPSLWTQEGIQFEDEVGMDPKPTNTLKEFLVEYPFLKPSSRESICTPAVMPMDVSPRFGDAYLLGTVFFRRYYTTYVREKTENNAFIPPMIGFGLSNHKAAITTEENLAQPGQTVTVSDSVLTKT